MVRLVPFQGEPCAEADEYGARDAVDDASGAFVGRPAAGGVRGNDDPGEAILDSTTPVGAVQLDALTGGDKTIQRTLISTAVDNAMHVHGTRLAQSQFR